MGRNYGLNEEKYTEEDVKSAMWVPFWIGLGFGVCGTLTAEYVFIWAMGWVN